MAKKAKNEARQQLRKRITELIDTAEGMDAPSSFHTATAAVLQEVLLGLRALDLGGVPEIFTPAPTPLVHGTDPVTIEELRWRAAFYVSVLVHKGNLVKDALEKVADKFGKGDEWVRAQRKSIRSRAAEGDRDIFEAHMAFRAMLAHLPGFLKNRTEAEILQLAKCDGQRLKLLTTQPKQASKNAKGKSTNGI